MTTAISIPPNRAVTLPNEGLKSVSPKYSNSKNASSNSSQNVQVFSVEDFKKGVTIGTSDSNNQSSASSNVLSGLLNKSPENLQESLTENLEESLLGESQKSFGRRYRSIDNNRIIDSVRENNKLTLEQKISKLTQIKKSAEEYEGMLINEMIKSMRQSAFVKTPGSDTYSEIAEKPFTAALTAAGGLGLSQTIVTQVAAQEGLSDVLTEHPQVMGPNYRQRLSPSLMPKASPFSGAQVNALSEPKTD
ncbi:MAG: hypothetical protein LBE31_08575 [Deltaproteobacteria bacterium]|jgi:Rod binding domain-containing protein|nr:hypothetical protein [Deltaproteobacteria bacterium]